VVSSPTVKASDPAFKAAVADVVGQRRRSIPGPAHRRARLARPGRRDRQRQDGGLDDPARDALAGRCGLD
jgi:hypothetical protein